MQTNVRHSDHVSISSGLGFQQECVDSAETVSSRTSVLGDFVLPSNAKESTERAQAEVVELRGMSVVDSPGHTWV